MIASYVWDGNWKVLQNCLIRASTIASRDLSTALSTFLLSCFSHPIRLSRSKIVVRHSRRFLAENAATSAPLDQAQDCTMRPSKSCLHPHPGARFRPALTNWAGLRHVRKPYHWRVRGGRAWRRCVQRARRLIVRQRAWRHNLRRAVRSGGHRPACRERVRAWRAAVC
jgi:hypothetical protein